MRFSTARSLVLALVAAAAVRLAAAGAPVDSPQPRSNDRWRSCFEQEKAELKRADASGRTAPRVLFLGDSITEAWRGTDNCEPCNPRARTGCDDVPAVFASHWGADRAAAMGIGGDQVEHLVWRMKNGALPKKNQPKVVVLLVGTNDLGAVARGTPPGVEADLRAAAPGVARRVQQAVQLVRQKLPASEVVLLGLLPRGTGSGEGKLPSGPKGYRWPSVFAQAISSVNGRLSDWARGQNGVHYLDCGSSFLSADRRSIDAALMPDALHPNSAGFERLAACIDPMIQALLR